MSEIKKAIESGELLADLFKEYTRVVHNQDILLIALGDILDILNSDSPNAKHDIAKLIDDTLNKINTPGGRPYGDIR